MAAAAIHAGLLQEGQLEALLEATLLSTEASYLGELDELERVKAEVFLERANQVADEQWQEVGLISASD